VPEFPLYHANSLYTVRIEPPRATNESVEVDDEQLELIKTMQTSVFSDLLNIKAATRDTLTGPHGGYVVIVDKSEHLFVCSSKRHYHPLIGAQPHFLDNQIDWCSMRAQFAVRPSVREMIDASAGDDLLLASGGRLVKLTLPERTSERLVLKVVERDMTPRTELNLGYVSKGSSSVKT
jgi:hypothetical protein